MLRFRYVFYLYIYICKNTTKWKHRGPQQKRTDSGALWVSFELRHSCGLSCGPRVLEGAQDYEGKALASSCLNATNILALLKLLICLENGVAAWSKWTTVSQSFQKPCCGPGGSFLLGADLHETTVGPLIASTDNVYIYIYICVYIYIYYIYDQMHS